AVLINNITANERLIQSLQEHLKELQTEYGKLQLDVYRFQKNQTNLQRKFSYDLSQCINQMKELKEQCEERINEISKKGNDAPQVKENKDFSEDSKRSAQADGQQPAPRQPEFKQTDLEQQRTSEDVPKAVPTVKRTDVLQPNEGVNGLTVIRKEDSRAVEEKLSVELKHPEGLAIAGMGHKEVPPKSEKELSPAEDGRNVAEQEAPQPAAEQIADEEVEREQLLNYDAKQSDSPPGQADQQAREALNRDKGVDYNLDLNEAESETDKQAALAGTETVQNSKEKM
ncbi:hypothetical protein ASZ78_010395, partial [Callipepla squamata]